jgi:hypothetical protein
MHSYHALHIGFDAAACQNVPEQPIGMPSTQGASLSDLKSVADCRICVLDLDVQREALLGSKMLIDRDTFHGGRMKCAS